MMAKSVNYLPIVCHVVCHENASLKGDFKVMANKQTKKIIKYINNKYIYTRESSSFYPKKRRSCLPRRKNHGLTWRFIGKQTAMNMENNAFSANKAVVSCP